MPPANSQMQMWAGNFGAEYTVRNSYSLSEMDEHFRLQHGFTRSEMFADALKDISKKAAILEVGTNIGLQLECLKALGFINLTGFDIQIEAVRRAKSGIAGIEVLQSSALEFPFKNGSFDLVFTSGVLIHIHPDNLKKVMSEMHRVSKRYILGFEYFSEKLTEIEYRGNKNLLWKADYRQIFLDLFPGLKTEKKRMIKYLASENANNLYLLEK